MITNNIGLNAGTIWNLLSQRDYMTVREIGELTHFKETLIMLSLGWLSRENKITFLDTEGTLKICVKGVIADIYY